jgi:hypothetical protein
MAGTAAYADDWAVKALAGAALIAAMMATAATGGGATNAPASFGLVFDGKHNDALLHEGPFTTSASFCLAGYAADVSIDAATETALRKFTCSGSAGDFTAAVRRLPAEHGGSGTWHIVEATGELANLRGKGTWTSDRLSGSPDDPASITFRSTWEGVADFDVSPPTIAVSSSKARKLRRPKGAYLLRLVLSLTDAGASRVSYHFTVVDPRKSLGLLASKSGAATAGTVTSVLRVRPTRRTRTLRLKIDASDPVGNQASFATTLRLR